MQHNDTTVDHYCEHCDRDSQQLITTGNVVILTAVDHYWECYDRDSQQLITSRNIVIESIILDKTEFLSQ